ncbi:Myc-type, basic helix-loop-helix (bHLH) domain protein [Kalmanozyma brasiliensis GHG001]|uniref:Myc-type, basic helix-loop-helix (bHLH) domain protein n=1 Tax=Kalmanozyma brasiliensis (strain GHG001) TaxID=1365824 RepID=UPI002867BFCE|nr:Myc-type, basic helix-loop-helix (bHLH) domain protein [Kalmanozyma brasiliensis GHG001]EST05237.2 Myc-type, basic helix-loop-helix (bHLH) domain protein [Kalmanozyma brasiliensis GHG001]
MMPKKRQHGFDTGAPVGSLSVTGAGPAIGSNASAAPNGASTASSHFSQPACATTSGNFFGPFGTNGLPSSFIDTDILLNDDLWNQFSPATTVNSSNGTDIAGHHHQAESDTNAKMDNASDRAFGESYVNIPYTGSLDMYGLPSRTFGTVRPAHDALSRLSKDTSSMDDGDSPDGSNGETTSTIATSILSPSSLGTTVGSLPKGTGTRHHRSTSNASSTHRSKTARSLSRSRNRAAAGASERSPSLDRGGVGKAPSSRARVNRRATVGPAALAGNMQTNQNPPAPTRSTSSSAAATGSSMGLSSSFQAQSHRWSLFGTPDTSNAGNLHLNFNDRGSYGAHGQPGTTSASSSLPTPLSFHASMAHLNLQTPPVSAAMHQMPSRQEETFNPFLFPPYSQATHRPGLDSVSEQPNQPSFPSAPQSAEVQAGEASQAGETKAAPITKPRRLSKSTSQASRDKLVKDIKAEAAKHDLKKTSSEEPPQEEDDDEDDDDDDPPTTSTGGKSEAEAKKLAEKRRKRRESHNAVERRRRDNINEKITELATLLPEAMLLDAIATSTQGGNSGTFAPALAAKAALAAAAAAAAKGDPMSGGADGQGNLPKSSTEAYAAALAPVDANSAALAAAQAKPNKGIILRKSVEYIRHLQQFLDMQMGRIGFLEAELARSHQALAASGMQAPPTTDPQQGLGMMHAFFNQPDNGMFGDHMQQPQPQQQQPHPFGQMSQQQPVQDFSAMNLLSLGMPMEQQSSQSQSMHQSGMNSSHSSSAHDAISNTPALTAWLEGFDQRTGLPRRSSVDPIEEEEQQDGEEDKELSRRGRSQASRLSNDGHDEHWRGRSRHKVGRGRAQVQEGSWPELQPSEAQSPMQLVSGEEGHATASFSDLGEMKLDL